MDREVATNVNNMGRKISKLRYLQRHHNNHFLVWIIVVLLSGQCWLVSKLEKLYVCKYVKRLELRTRKGRLVASKYNRDLCYFFPFHTHFWHEWSAQKEMIIFLLCSDSTRIVRTWNNGCKKGSKANTTFRPCFLTLIGICELNSGNTAAWIMMTKRACCN